jgi:hypothetical protein
MSGWGVDRYYLLSHPGMYVNHESSNIVNGVYIHHINAPIIILWVHWQPGHVEGHRCFG